MNNKLRNLLIVLTVLLGMYAPWASAQTLPVQVSVSGNVATATIGSPGAPVADLTLTFDDAIGLNAGSIGISAEMVSATDPLLLQRLPSSSLTRPDAALPLLITIEPSRTGGLSFRRSVRYELHTHALPYTVGSSLRVFKAPLGGNFRDITHEIAPGSVRARGTTGGFSQFLVLPDLRSTSLVIDQKIAYLRARVAGLVQTEQRPFTDLIYAAESSIQLGDHDDAILAIDAISTRATARAGIYIADTWRATRDVENDAGELIAGAATLKFSVAYLRDFGQ